MAETAQNMLIDKDLRPTYYDDFHCLAGDCRLSCCKGSWSISFNKKDYLSLKRQSGSQELNARLENGVRRVRKGPKAEMYYGEFDMDSGVCPLLGEDSLCMLQKEKGHAALPRVCRVYPRTESYMPSGYLERSLSPSCEGVLALLWELPEGIGFCSDPLPKAQCKELTPIKGDLPLWFSVVREWCVDLLQNRRFTLAQRIFLMGLGLKELADGEEDIKRWMERAAVLPDVADTAKLLPTGNPELAMYLSSCIHTLLKLPSNDANHEAIISGLLKGLELKSHADVTSLAMPLGPYRETQARYREQFAGREYFMENLMVSIFFFLHMPSVHSREELWKGYVNFCNLYAFYHFLAVMSCRKDAPGDRDELFSLIVFASRSLIHSGQRQSLLRDEFFKNDSATLAHMAILLCG